MATYFVGGGRPQVPPPRALLQARAGTRVVELTKFHKLLADKKLFIIIFKNQKRNEGK